MNRKASLAAGIATAAVGMVIVLLLLRTGGSGRQPSAAGGFNGSAPPTSFLSEPVQILRQPDGIAAIEPRAPAVVRLVSKATCSSLSLTSRSQVTGESNCPLMSTPKSLSSSQFFFQESRNPGNFVAID